MEVNKSTAPSRACPGYRLAADSASPAEPTGSARAPAWFQHPSHTEHLARNAHREGAAAPDLQLRKAVQASQCAEGFLVKEIMVKLSPSATAQRNSSGQETDLAQGTGLSTSQEVRSPSQSLFPIPSTGTADLAALPHRGHAIPDFIPKMFILKPVGTRA